MAAAIAILNFAALTVSTVLFIVLYGYSVSPARLEARIGPRAYERCAKFRKLSVFCMVAIVVAYLVTSVYSPGILLPRRFPWRWAPSVAIGAVLGAVAVVIFVKASRAAGRESFKPDKLHQL